MQLGRLLRSMSYSRSTFLLVPRPSSIGGSQFESASKRYPPPNKFYLHLPAAVMRPIEPLPLSRFVVGCPRGRK